HQDRRLHALRPHERSGRPPKAECSEPQLPRIRHSHGLHAGGGRRDATDRPGSRRGLRPGFRNRASAPARICRAKALVRTPIKAACVLCALALFAARAEDIDIFTAGAGTAVRPNVLVVLDNSSNWSATFGPNSCNASTTKFAAEICALSQVALGLDENVRLGLMMFAETGENGGYVRFGARDMNPRNRTALATMVQNFVPQGAGADSSGSNQPYGKAMYEAFKYFGGYTSPAHANDDVGGSPLDRAHFGTAALAGWTTDEGGDI